jgi:hypothetical protein
LVSWLQEEGGPLTEGREQLITVLEGEQCGDLARSWSGLSGRPVQDRAALARSYVAKAVLWLPTPLMRVERLQDDEPLRRLYGWESVG